MGGWLGQLTSWRGVVSVNSKKHRWDLLTLLHSVCCIHICFTHIPLVTLDMKRGYLEIINISLSEKGISAI